MTELIKAVIQSSFTKDEAKSVEGRCITPENFAQVKDWSKFEANGLEYYVNKAVELGAKKGKVVKMPAKKEAG